MKRASRHDIRPAETQGVLSSFQKSSFAKGLMGPPTVAKQLGPALSPGRRKTDRYFKITRNGVFGLGPGIELANSSLALA